MRRWEHIYSTEMHKGRLGRRAHWGGHKPCCEHDGSVLWCLSLSLSFLCLSHSLSLSLSIWTKQQPELGEITHIWSSDPINKQTNKWTSKQPQKRNSSADWMQNLPSLMFTIQSVALYVQKWGSWLLSLIWPIYILNLKILHLCYSSKGEAGHCSTTVVLGAEPGTYVALGTEFCTSVLCPWLILLWF